MPTGRLREATHSKRHAHFVASNGVLALAFRLLSETDMTRTNLSWPSEDPDGSIHTTPDHMLLVQFAELLQRSTERAPEQRLMGAVLQDAIRAFCQNAGAQKTRGRRIFGETAEWFESPDVSWPFSFENICDTLLLDPAWIRGLLRRWLATHAKTTQPPLRIPPIRRIAGRRQSVTGPRVVTTIAC